MAADCGTTCPIRDGFLSYSPHLAANAVLLAVFGALVPVALYFGFRSQKTPVYTVFLILGLLFEVLGFIGRLLLRDNDSSGTLFFLSFLGSLLGPPLFGLALSVVLPHVLNTHGSGRPRPVLVGFFLQWLGFVAIIVQAIGASFVAFELNNFERSSATKIVIAGLAAQLVFFVLLLSIHLYAISGSPSSNQDINPKYTVSYNTPDFKWFLRAIETSTLLFAVYTIYRLAELATGLDGNLFQSQSAYMVLCGGVPALAAGSLAIFHPGRAFGRAWTRTSPLRLKRRAIPPPMTLPQPSPVAVAHHRYDPQIAKTSPTAQKHRQSQPPDVALKSSPGLPSNPRPSYSKMPSPTMSLPSNKSSPTTERRPSDTRMSGRMPGDPRISERKSQVARRMVDSEALW
jgi:hypothetical protein